MMKKSLFSASVVFLFISAGVQASTLDDICVTTLRAVTTNLDGSGVHVAQPEASFDRGTNWEVNPGAVGQPAGLFTYHSSSGSTTDYPNSLSSESGHANAVGQTFYGIPNGVATNVAQVDNFDADYFVNHYVISNLTVLGNSVVNQSFTFGNVSADLPTPTNYLSVSDQQQLDSAYDDYAAAYGTLFISPANNGGSVSPPGTAYNSIGVGAYGGSSSIGPTLDNGRCKPDLTAPAAATSYSTPQVAGAAAVLLQAALRGDGGSDTNFASDLRTIKALLLNGAVKPSGWTNGSGAPLDARYGAGVLNVFNSYEQLASGRHSYVSSTTVAGGSVHPPAGASGTVGVLSGWDFSTNASSVSEDAVQHYYFNVTNCLAPAKFNVMATLVWNRQQHETNINNLDLFLYNCANSNLIACSTSLVDNVEHFFVTGLPSGRYDLQVWKAGGTNAVSPGEAYALAWDFYSDTLLIAETGTNLILTWPVHWPVYPQGSIVETTTNLAVPAWSTNSLPATVFTRSTNTLQVPPTNALQFFRLRPPSL